MTLTPEFLASVATVITAVVPLVIALIRLRREVRHTHQLVNSRMDELVALTRKAAFAEGRLESHDAGPSVASAAMPPRSLEPK